MNTSNTFADIVSGVNVSSNGALIYLMLAVIFFVFLARGIKNGDANQGALSSGLITTVVAVFFWGAGLLAWTYMLIPFTIFVGALLWRFFQ